MPATRGPDPELLPLHRPRCPNCQTRMITVAIASGPEGFERRTFDCRKCGHRETDLVVSDPLKSGAVGWTAGDGGRISNRSLEQQKFWEDERIP